MNSNIPLRIRNTYNPQAEGTLIDKDGSGNGIKAISLVEDVVLVSTEGSRLCGKVGIDSRIFSALSKANISVRLISQASSEIGIGFVINSEDSSKASRILNEEFTEELNQNDISTISTNEEIAIIAITGRHNYALKQSS